ncbi:MAG: hypothetical protein RLZZ502_23 [Pseudomonadota bacterium]|jgi:L-lactate dehydrogenase
MPLITSDQLLSFAQQAFAKVGLDGSLREVMARSLVEADLLGHYTHGTNLLVPYCTELAEGKMSKSGMPVVLKESAVTALWDGQRLPGPYLTELAITAASKMARQHGTGTVVMRRSHHIACLAAFLEAPARSGLVTQIQCSDPLVASVAPFGGCVPMITPNPLAASYPTSADPIIIDVSMSVTAMGQVQLKRSLGEPIPEGWLMDSAGNGTTDPNVLWQEPKGSILPLGGFLAGHKGFALGLMVEAMTGGLSGLGRADDREAHGGWGANVCVQVIDPDFFGNLTEFKRQMDVLVNKTHASQTDTTKPKARVPGEGGLARKLQQLARGIALPESIYVALSDYAEYNSLNNCFK